MQIWGSKMTKADFDNYMKFRNAAKDEGDKIAKILEEKGYELVRIYEPEVISAEDDKPKLFMHMIIQQDFPLD